MKRIFSIIMEWGLGLPTGTIAFWGTLVPRILTVDYTFNKNYQYQYRNCSHKTKPINNNQLIVHIKLKLTLTLVSLYTNYIIVT